MKSKNGSKILNISIDEDGERSDILCNVRLSIKEGLFVRFLTPDHDNEHPHIRFLFGTNGLVRTLHIVGYGHFPGIDRQTSHTINWLLDIIQLCPLVEEVKIHKAAIYCSGNRTTQHPSIKKLIFGEISSHGAFDFLKYLSFNLPNLREISFHTFSSYEDHISSYPYPIYMPHTTIDLLTWTEKVQDDRFLYGSEVYIKLQTDRKLKFYVGIRHMLFPIDSKRYLVRKKCIQFDITCKNLREIRLIRPSYPEYNSNLVF